MRACDPCTKEGKKCIKFAVLVYVCDCEDKNRRAAELLSGINDPILQLLTVLPDSFHNAKSLKAAFANWWLFYDGWRIILCSLHTLRQDFRSEIGVNLRKVPTLEAFCHCDWQSTSSVAYVAPESVESCLHKVKEDKDIVYTLVPDKFRKTNNNKKGVFMAPTDVISDPCVASLLYVSDIERKMLYQV